MPTYEYVCIDCGSRLDVRATIVEKAAGLTPQCVQCEDGGHVRRAFSAVALVGGRPARAMSQDGGCCGGSCGCGAG